MRSSKMYAHEVQIGHSEACTTACRVYNVSNDVMVGCRPERGVTRRTGDIHLIFTSQQVASVYHVVLQDLRPSSAGLYIVVGWIPPLA